MPAEFQSNIRVLPKMKVKKRRGVEVHPKVQAFINSVTSAPLESIDIPLSKFTWEYDKGDFYHWVELMNHFDSYFEKYIRPRKELQLEGDFNQITSPFPKDAVLQILRVTRIILDNCINKHCYSSYEHLCSLLASTDTDVVIASLETLAAFVKKPVQSNRAVRWHGDKKLNVRLFSLCQGWGGKEEGLGLVACAIENGCDPSALKQACSLHFEFYSDVSDESQTESSDCKQIGLKIIHKEDLQNECRSDLDVLAELVDEYKVPPSHRFSLLTRLRFARSFCNLSKRRQFLCIRLLSFTIFLQSNPESEDLSAFFSNEPEFVHELVTLLHCEDTVPERIRILANLALAAQAQDRPRQSSVLSAISAGGNRGILPTLVQKAVSSLSGAVEICTVQFVEALLYLITVLVSTSAGCAALRESGLIPTLLPFLKDTVPSHTHLVASAVHILEAFMDYSNPAATLFRDLGGLDDAIKRLKVEVNRVEEDMRKSQQSTVITDKGKAPLLEGSDAQQVPAMQSPTVVSFQSRLLLKVLLRAISLGTYAPGNAARIHGIVESILASCMCTIFRHAKEFGGGVFSLAASLMSDLIHKDPTCFQALDSAGLPAAFLESITGEVLPSSEAVSCIPHTLDALCLNNTGLQSVKDKNALNCFVRIFTSKMYLRALANETPSLLASGLDELMRHAPSLRADGVDACVEILRTIALIGGCIGSSSSMSNDADSANAPVPMEAESDASQQQADASSSDTANDEAYLLEYIHNVARLLEALLQNADTSRVFVEKKGVEAILKLYSLPNLPVSFGGSSVAHSMSSAFRAFSPSHAVPLSRAVCGALRESLMSTIEALGSLASSRLCDMESSQRTKLVRRLSSTELYLSLSSVLVRSTNTMLAELSSSGISILHDIGKVYRQILWQISLYGNAKPESKKEEPGSSVAASNAESSGGREGEEDSGVISSAVQYVNPVSIRDGSGSHWDTEPDFFPMISSGDGFHRRTRREQGAAADLFTQRLRRLARHTPGQSSQLDNVGSSNASDTVQVIDTASRKSPDSLDFDVMMRLVSSARGLYVALGKSMVVPSRRRDDVAAPGSAAKEVASAIAKLLNENLSFVGDYGSPDLEVPRSIYLQKLVDDIQLVLFDTRRHTSNTLLINNFYAYDALGKLLQTFHIVSQMLWTTLQQTDICMDDASDKAEVSECDTKKTCLFETLQSYAKLMEHLVTPTLLLSPQPMAQMLVQQVVGGVIPVPKEPEKFVQKLQSQVLEFILPVWNHQLFPKCSVNFVSTVISIITHIYSGVTDMTDQRNTTTRALGPPPDESSISMIVEMGFSRERAEEALRRVVTNSVEMAMEWLFSHPEEPQEDDELARALALSLGSSEAPTDTDATKGVDAAAEEVVVNTPPVEDMLNTCLSLLQSNDALAFPITDLIVTICSRNKGQDRARAVCCLIYHLKSCPRDDMVSDNSVLSVVSHILALLLNEDSTAREIAAEQGLISLALDILSTFDPQTVLDTSIAAPKWTTALILILDLFSQYKPKVLQDQKEQVSVAPAGPSESHSDRKAETRDTATEPMSDPFSSVLGKYTGFMTVEEQHHAMTIACKFLKSNIPATTAQAVLQLCARLSKTHSVAMQFLDSGGLNAILSLPRRSLFPGFDSVAAVIIRHLLEDPQTLQQAMELEIRHTLTTATHRSNGRMTPRMFLTSLTPVILRNPTIFMQASAAVCHIENVGGQPHVILSKEREKEKEKEKERDKEEKEREKTKSTVSGDGSKVQDSASKSLKGHHKKVPPSFAQVIEQLLDVVLHSPAPDSSARNENDNPNRTDKGKSKCEDNLLPDQDSLSERSAGLAKVAFILKLMMEILLMYSGAVGVVLRRDSESSQNRMVGSEVVGHGGLLYHVLHRLLPYSTEKGSEKVTEDEWREKLSDKAAYFLLAVCVRSAEGRRRIVSEISRALTALTNNVMKGAEKKLQPATRKVRAFVFLINIILSAHASNNTQAPGFSSDMAKAMIDAGLVQSLTCTLEVIDLDHPDAVKLVNAVLKALEALTRVASTAETMYTVTSEKKVAPDNNLQTEGTDVHSHQQNNDNEHAGDVPIAGDSGAAEENMVTAGGSHVNPEHIREVSPSAGISVSEHLNATGQVFIHDPPSNPSGSGDGAPPDITFGPDNGQDEDDEEMDAEDAEEEEEDDEDEDEMEGAEGVTHLSPPDTDVEDQDDQALGGEYHEYILEEEEEEDDAWQANPVIEVRWRDGLTRLNNGQVLGHGRSATLGEFAGDPFQNMNEIFSSFRRSNVVDRRRPANGYRNLNERTGDRAGAFNHPLLTRQTVTSSGGSGANTLWTTAGGVTNNADALLGVGGFDVAPFYMYDHVLSDNAGNRLFGERGIGGLLPPLLDFSMDPGYLTGRRGTRSDNRLNTWTDDGQPQAGAYAAAVAQSIEQHYISHLRSLAPRVASQADNAQAVSETVGQDVNVEQMDLDSVRNPETSDPPAAESHTEAEANLPREASPPHFQGPNEVQETVPMTDSEMAVEDTNGTLHHSQDTHMMNVFSQDDTERHPDVETTSTDANMEEAFRPGPSNMEEEPHQETSHAEENVVHEEAGDQQVEGTTGGVNPSALGNNEGNASGMQPSPTDANTIDPTFLEALPDYLRAEVLASHETQSARSANPPPPPLPTEDIDPEFLAALPPDIQAEVLAQQRAQRIIQAHQVEGQPVDMDSASIIATFPAELREEVLLTSSEQVLAALPPSLLAEAQLLRERAMNQYQSRGLFGGSNRFGIRRSNPVGGLDRAVGSTTGLSVSRRPVVPSNTGVKAKEVEGKPLVDIAGLKSMLQLLHLAQPLGKGLLQRLLLNLCAHSVTRTCIVKLLLDMLKPGHPSSDGDTTRLYGCRSNVVYARCQIYDGVPPLVSRRVLEILTHLSKHHDAGADLLTYLKPSGAFLTNEDKSKGKAKLIEGSEPADTSSKGEIPLILLLKLLDQPLYSRSSAHLEQLMVLLEAVTNHISSKYDAQTAAKGAEVKPPESSSSNPEIPGSSRQDQSVPPERDQNVVQNQQTQEPSTSGSEQKIDISEILSSLPQLELRKLSRLLAQEGLSDVAYTRVAEVLKKLAHIAPAHRWLFKEELENAVRALCLPAISELNSLCNAESMALSTGSMVGASILRVLQCLSSLTAEVKDDASEQDESSAALWNLNNDLDPLWQSLSSCISRLEARLGSACAYMGAAVAATSNGNAGVSAPLPPETQRVLPFVEAFFVLSEKLRARSSQSIHLEPTSATAREIKEAAGSLVSTQKRSEGDLVFLRFSEKHRRMLNAFLRQNPALLEKSFNILLKTPRLIDFDNKRAYFRSRIRQQHDQQHFAPLRICVRRPYVLEDSYNQLRMRTVDELKGRLTVQFQGEEGIDAGGLTREWYQLLSRVIFDKGALLFTTVGNESTFQPNPNSVYQTEHLSYFKFVGRVVAKALYDGQLLDVYFTRSFYKHILGVKVTYHDIEAVDPDYYKNLKWMLENDISDVLDVFFSVDADEEKHILYEKTEVTDIELIPGGRNIRVTEENKHEYVDLNAENKLTTAIRPQINAFLEGFNELVNRDLISIFNDKELELLISGLPEIDLDDLKANTEYTGYTAASPVIQWFWEVVSEFSKEDMARLLQFITGTSKVPLEGFRALQGISGPQRCQIHKAYGAPERLPTAHTCFNQLDLPEYSSKEQLQERLQLAIHEASEGFGFG